MELLVKKLTKTARIPSKSYTNNEAGLDFYSDSNLDLQPNRKILVKTGIAVQIPENICINKFEYGINTNMCFTFYLKLYSRSGLSCKHGIEVGAGVIDSSYRGEICVVLFNHSDKVFRILRGDKIAQGVLYMIPCYDIKVCDTLNNTKRGSEGFGSSDKN